MSCILVAGVSGDFTKRLELGTLGQPLTTAQKPCKGREITARALKDRIFIEYFSNFTDYSNEEKKEKYKREPL